MASSDLQNSYGPEMAPNGHDLPQTVAVDGLEALPPSQQYALAPPYNVQSSKNNGYNSPHAEQPDETGRRKKRVAGLPIVAFWGIIIGLVLILAIGLGVGLARQQWRESCNGRGDYQRGRRFRHNVCRIINAVGYNREYQ
ncbi:hypothetical protein KVR01_006235 [Diaporthe batatas]|uniref:uncharacterized protein n=1 Tax=Diaporthe batatas TaxID=748121 RepID=UPI001D047FE6|nr:uncharacterized protein KVR01_006235 [Diaporthe batatas]KAG8164317.1 hypothetical protein KVR01_006235 [Diaporthe batatas]